MKRSNAHIALSEADQRVVARQTGMRHGLARALNDRFPPAKAAGVDHPKPSLDPQDLAAES
jgi:hypothetical protein